ncbi:MAG: hypothetical protein PHX38_07450 [Sulfuricella sp.]|nr:hypothetical protein [Sulfuricella sp.]
MCRLLGALLAAVAAPSFAGTVDDVKSLMERNQPAQACQLGRLHPEELGNPDFDFYFGIVCIDAGHASEGILALERYLLNFPANDRARLELARGYFVLGEDMRAREEFANVQKQNPPPEVQATIERYVDAIRAREGRYHTTSGFYVEAGVGYDDNVNGGVSDANINLPVLGSVQVANNGVRSADSFVHVAAGGQVAKPVAPGVSVFGGLGYDGKYNQSDTAFSMESLGGYGGVTALKDKNLFRATVSISSLTVGSDRYRDVNGISGEWFHQLDELQGVNGFIQYATLDYTGTNQVRDAELTGVGVGYRKAFIGRWQPVFNAGLSLSEERNQRGRPDLGRDIAGLTLGLSLSPHPKWGLNAGYIYQESRYQAPDTVLNTTRDDDYQALNVAATYLYSKNISIRGEVAASDNASNLSLYSYRRNFGGVNVRYEFK